MNFAVWEDCQSVVDTSFNFEAQLSLFLAPIVFGWPHALACIDNNILIQINHSGNIHPPNLSSRGSFGKKSNLLLSKKKIRLRPRLEGSNSLVLRAKISFNSAN
jgi:hypothetical protein